MGHSSQVWNGSQIIIYGGWNGFQVLSDVIFIDLKKGVDKLSFNIPSIIRGEAPMRQFHTSSIIENQMFVFGGGDGKFWLNDLLILDLNGLEWTGPVPTQGISPVQLVLNRVRPKMMSSQEMLSVDDVTDILALPLLGLVFEDEQVIVSTNRGEPLTLSDGGSPAARAYSNIAGRLQGEDIPLMDPAKLRRGLRAKMRELMQTKIF